MKIYELNHAFTDANDADYVHRFQCGVFSTRELAEAAAARLRTQPGFRDSPDAFAIEEVELDHVRWPDGFTSPHQGWLD